MIRSLRSSSGGVALFGRLAAACAVLAVLLAPSLARAVVPYEIHWVMTEDADSCESADLGRHDGEPFFHVNGTPLPAYQVPGALLAGADGSHTNTILAPFDSVLLRVGTNQVDFVVVNETGDDSCSHQHNVVSLRSPQLGIDKPLFDVRRDGTAFAGSTALSLQLAEINPPLAQDIENLQAAIEAEQKDLLANASKIADLAVTLHRIEQLDADLANLATRPLDEIDPTELDDLLQRYADVLDDATRAALEQFLADLQKSIADLQAELASLIDNFGQQADAAADLATQAARQAGFDPDDPNAYALGKSDVPPVAIPNLSGVPGAFDPGHDPYDAYADDVIAALGDDVSGGVVTARADFLAQVRAWRANQKALQKALQANGASVAEVNAFLNAQNKVTAYVNGFLDDKDWFKDSPVPPDVRAAIDGVLADQFADLAAQMKDAVDSINPANKIDLSQTQLWKTIAAFAGAMGAIEDTAQPYLEVMLALTQASERVAISFVPFVGPTLDFCEAVTGRAWCMPDGAELSDEERIFAGAGVAVSGVAHFWGGVKGVGAIGAKGAEIAEDVAKVDEAIAKGLHANPRNWYKTLKGACTKKPLDSFEIVAGKWLQQDGRALIGIGDDGVRVVLDIPADAADDLAKAPDFLSITKGNKLALSEVKSATVAADGTKKSIDVEKALAQLNNAMGALGKRGLAGDVERAELIMTKGAPLNVQDLMVKDGYLVRVSTGKRITLKDFKISVIVIEL